MWRRNGAQTQLVRAPARLLMLTIAIAVLAVTGVAAADPISAEQIINALAPKLVTRGLTLSPPEAARASPDQAKFLDSLGNRPTRSLTLDEQQELATIRLKNKDNPLAPENRRVQVVNMATKTVASQ